MKKILGICIVLLLVAVGISQASAALVVPNEIQMPGTQPKQVGNLETPDKCDNCHGGYNKAVEPAFNWRGSMMANATRDPIFWATMAIAEQDFEGSGDLCIRCHSTAGWLGGRSTPTDGSALTAGDADGVECDFCHKMTNPDNSELKGVMTAPFLAYKGSEGFYGSGMASIWGGAEKLGPYNDAAARHKFIKTDFHRDQDFCGTCHDVSNPAVGDLAHNNGAQVPLAAGTFSGVPGSPLEGKAAFNNMPYQYGVVERTYSEYKSSLLSKTPISGYNNLPADLKAGAIQAVSGLATYDDGTARGYTCQACHMRAVTGTGCNKAGAPLRTDMGLHDMTGGNYWMPDAMLYMNDRGTLRLGGGLTALQKEAISAGKARAEQQLDLAASLSVVNDTVKVVNLTGHKLISGYPEGRRMWLNIKWYDSANNLLREDGKYGTMTVSIAGAPREIKTILDLNDPNTKIYEAHYGMTQEWANQLLGLGYSPALPLRFDRVSGAVSYTLGDLAAQAPASYADTFHFVLNNTVTKDNRIPPYGFSYDEAKVRNSLPVPAAQYGGGSPGSTYKYYDEFALSKPSGAAYADISLLYQPTSWEYIQFLYLANNKQNAFLANEGDFLLDAWLNTGMAEPRVMATTRWGTASAPPQPACSLPGTPTLTTITPAKKAITIGWSATNPSGGYRVYYDQAGKYQFRAAVGPTVTSYKDGGLTSRTSYCYVVTAWTDCDGDKVFNPAVDKESPISNKLCATAN